MTVKDCETNQAGISKDTREVLNEYLEMLRQYTRKEATIKKYRSMLERFLSECQVPLDAISEKDVLTWVREFAVDKNHKTIRLYLSCLSSFFKFCLEEGFMKEIVIKNRWKLKISPSLPSLPKYLTNEEYARVIVAAEKLSVRDKALILFLFSSGCRSGEICSLSIEDIDFENQTAKIKGRMLGHVLFSKECALLLKEYLQVRAAGPRDPLFASSTGQRLQPGTISVVTRRLGEMAELNTRLNPSLCRNTFAKKMFEQGADLRDVAVAMGHGNLNSTFRYLWIPLENRTNAINIKF